jgi:hypothetical protein
MSCIYFNLGHLMCDGTKQTIGGQRPCPARKDRAAAAAGYPDGDGASMAGTPARDRLAMGLEEGVGEGNKGIEERRGSLPSKNRVIAILSIARSRRLGRIWERFAARRRNSPAHLYIYSGASTKSARPIYGN